MTSEEQNILEENSKEQIPKDESVNENIPREQNTESTKPQTTNIKPQTGNMEVHHHPEVPHKSKSWKEYFLEFLMIFLAVTLGFFAEIYVNI